MDHSYVKESFSYWVAHPEDTTETDIQHLQASVREYPYCQMLHVLIAKAYAQHQPQQAESFIQKAAAYAISRNALRKLIQNEFEWSVNVKNRQFENVLIWPNDDPHHPKLKPYQPSKWQLPELPKIALLEELDAVIEQFNKKPLPELPPIDDTTFRENALQSELELIKTSTQEEDPEEKREQERREQMAIIDSFIENENNIGPIRANLYDIPQTEPQDLAKQRNQVYEGPIVSEGMAKIMIRQGKIEKAIEIYEQLILKKPEKKAYFAEKIKELTTE